MRVALSMREVSATSYYEPRDAISHDWIKWMAMHEYETLLVPNCLNDSAEYIQSMEVDGIILTGGNDAVASETTKSDISPARDVTERDLIKYAINNQIPMFCVCRGMHVINRYFGGEVLSSLKDKMPSVAEHVNSVHGVRLDDRFAAPDGNVNIVTNSFHNQGFGEQQVSPELEVFAVSENDNVVEGVAHRTLPILAVQWHPERPHSAAVYDDYLIGRLMRKSVFWSDV